MKNLIKAIADLNAPRVIDDEIYGTLFNFKIRKEEGVIHIYDEHEHYHIDYLEHANYTIKEIADELGFEFEPIKEDKVMNQLLEAIRKDFGKDAYIEWEDNVEMIVVK